jgi:tetratricopeptide (TPR) repeat protein
MFRQRLSSTVQINVSILLLVCAVSLLSITVRAQDDTQDNSAKAIELFEQGQDEHAKGNFTKAIELYEQATKILPEFPEAEYQKGNAFLSIGKDAEAEKSFRRAVEIRGDWTLALTALGSALVRRGSYDEADKLLAKALSIDDSSFPAYSAVVELRLKTGASTEVLRTLLEKIRGFSSRVNATAAVFATQATLESALGDTASAKKSVARAVALDPNNRSALYLKAGFAISDGDLVLAEEVTRAIEKIDAGTPSAKVLRARLLIAANKGSDAEALLKTIAPPTAETAELLKRIELSNEQSTDVLEKALAANPRDVMVLGKLCSAYRVTAPDKALDLCRRALDLEPSNIDHAIGYGAALLQAKRYEDAVTVLRKLSALAPDNATIHANLGTALFDLKLYADAKVEYRWLTAHNPVPPIAYYFLAICHDQLGEYLDAGANYNLFLKNADAARNQLEIDKVKLRLPILNKQIDRSGGKQKNKSGK